jgi:hypothetical protein
MPSTQEQLQQLLVTANDFATSDVELKHDDDFTKVRARFSQLPSQQVLSTTVKALQAKKHTVHVVANEAEALEVVKSLVKDGMTVFNGHSTTLEQIGYVDWVKTIDDKITKYVPHTPALNHLSPFFRDN